MRYEPHEPSNLPFPPNPTTTQQSKPLEKIGKVDRDQNLISVLLNSLVTPIIHFSHCFRWLNLSFAFSTLLWSASKLSSSPRWFWDCGVEKWAKGRPLWSNQASSPNFLTTDISWMYWHQLLLSYQRMNEALGSLDPRTGTAQVWAGGKRQRALLFEPMSLSFPLAQEKPWKQYSVCPQPKFLAYL